MTLHLTTPYVPSLPQDTHQKEPTFKLRMPSQRPIMTDNLGSVQDLSTLFHLRMWALSAVANANVSKSNTNVSALLGIGHYLLSI